MAGTTTIGSILASGVITDADVTAMRRQFYGDMQISETEAAQLFQINDKCASHALAWSSFFTEALSDFIVHQMKPDGNVDQANAAWLMQHIDADGKTESFNELELLVQIVEKAKSVPDSLNRYVLNQVKNAVLNGDGELRAGDKLQKGVVTAGDVKLLKRVLYAYGSEANIGITTDEAEILFDINDATADAENHASWNVLFGQAIASHLMMAQGYSAPDRQTALRHEEWLDNPPMTQGEFLAAMVDGLRNIYKLGLIKKVDSETNARDKNLGEEKANRISEKLTLSEVDWLISRINRDGKLGQAERAALSFIKQESPDIASALKPLLDLVA